MQTGATMPGERMDPVARDPVSRLTGESNLRRSMYGNTEATRDSRSANHEP